MTARPRLFLSLAAGLLLILLVVVVSRRGSDPASSSRVWLFEVELSASAGTFSQLFWTADINFVEEQSARKPLQAGAGVQTVRFTLPPGVRSLRLDPTDAAGEVVIGRMALRDTDGRLLTSFTAANLTSPHQVASITAHGHETVVVTTGDDPWVIIPIGCLSGSGGNTGASLVTAPSLVLVSLATIGLLAACCWVISRDLYKAAGDGSLAVSTRWTWLWLPVVFLLVFSAKLLLVREFPATVPYWDQWDGEARGLYVPYYNCGLSWSQMFALHNEHRIFFSRLLALGLLLLNGQWDPRLQQVVNAGIHSLLAVMLLAILWRGLEWRRLDLVALIVVPVFALPFAWENVLLGFQSAFYFFLLFSLPALWLTTAFRAGSAAWWLGWLCALCGLFTAAGGIVMPAIIVGVTVLKMLNGPRQWRELFFTLPPAAIVLALGVLTKSPPLAHHEALKATTLRTFLSAFCRNLAWPWIDHPVAGILMWLPIAALVAVVVVRWRRTTVIERFVVGLAAWVAVQAAAIAYGRGGGALVPATRYQDFLSLGFVANTVVLVLAVRHAPSGTLARRLGLATIAVVLWSGATVAGLDSLTGATMTTLEFWRPHWAAQTLNVRRYVLTGNSQELQSRPALDLPYPSADSLIEALGQPIVRRILPPAVRRPIYVLPRTVTHEAFVPFGAYPITPNDATKRGWGSYTARGNPSMGDFESEPITTCESGRYLSVPVAGYLGLAGLTLAVRDVATGERHDIRPARLAREDWVSAAVRCPHGSFVLAASDQRPDYWFAFREPVEAGWASLGAEALISASFRLMIAALALMVVAVRVS